MSHPETGGNAQDYILAALSAGRDGRYKKYVNGVLFGLAVFELGKRAKAKVRTYAHSVSVDDDDEIYVEIQNWLIDNIPAKRRRSLSARSFRDTGDYRRGVPAGSSARAFLDSLEDDPKKKSRQGQLILFYDGNREQTVRISGHRIRISVVREEIMMGATRRNREKINFIAANPEAREAVIEFLRALAKTKHENGHSRLYVANSWGDWNLQERPPRSLDTVILREGLKESLVDDLGRFMSHEADYAENGIPWHRGYLFHGPPGTGKTSLAKALAERFEMDIYYIPLSDLTKDSELGALFSRVAPRSILILEDVDIVHATKSRDDAESAGVSLSGILNALDGMITPHGLVTVMTTNDIDALDPALRRAGRSDVVEELGYLDNDQLSRLLRLMLKESAEHPDVEGANVTHAEVIESVKRVIGDREAMKQSVLAKLDSVVGVK